MGHRLPPKTEVQTLLFDSTEFEADEAKAWARENGYKSGAVDHESFHLRVRQSDPERFGEGTFRTVYLAPGVQAIVAVPKTRLREEDGDGVDPVAAAIGSFFSALFGRTKRSKSSRKKASRRKKK